MRGIRRVVRIKLTDFINSLHETDILTKLDSIQRYGGIYIKLWYNDGDIDTSQLNEFKNNYKEILERGNITILDAILLYEFVWYEISCRGKMIDNAKYKFCSVYNNSSDIMLCLNELETFIKFSSTK